MTWSTKLLSILPVKLKSMETPVGAILRAPGKPAARGQGLLECCGSRPGRAIARERP